MGVIIKQWSYQSSAICFDFYFLFLEREKNMKNLQIVVGWKYNSE